MIFQYCSINADILITQHLMAGWAGCFQKLASYLVTVFIIITSLVLTVTLLVTGQSSNRRQILMLSVIFLSYLYLRLTDAIENSSPMPLQNNAYLNF